MRESLGQALKSLAFLIDIYERTVGHNANLLLNFSPDYSGALPVMAVARFRALGRWLRECYGSANAVGTNWTGPAALQSGESVIIRISTPLEKIGRIVLQEDQTLGQRIRSYQLEGMGSSSQWIKLLRGQSIGHKRIVVLDANNRSHSFVALRLTVLQSVGSTVLRTFSAQRASNCAVPRVPPSMSCELLSDYAYSGSTMGPPNATASVPQCCSTCRATAGCVGFTRAKGGSCSLFKSIGGGSTVSGATAGSPVRQT